MVHAQLIFLEQPQAGRAGTKEAAGNRAGWESRAAARRYCPEQAAYPPLIKVAANFIVKLTLV
jgi:hypothetical protein